MAFKMGSQTSTAIKICGITEPNQAKAIAAFGVDAIGVIGVEGSPRFVSENLRRKIFKQLSTSSQLLERVWVIADLNDTEIERGLQGHGLPSIVQFHGEESPKRCDEFRKKYPSIQWWKAIRIHTPLDLSMARSFEGHADALLLDAWSPTELGGTGNRLPIEWLKEAKFELPWWLAGGICAEYIPEILSQVSPFGIDASSRLEASAGIKDLKKVEALVKAIKETVR